MNSQINSGARGVVYLDPDPSAWSTEATTEQAARWNDELADRVEAVFPGLRVEIGNGPWSFASDDDEVAVRDFVNTEYIHVIEQDPQP